MILIPNRLGLVLVFGGVALTALTYFILMKGIKGTSYAKESFDLIGGDYN